jgi:hypothetical protein
MWTDDFGSIGSRTTGTGAGKFLAAAVEAAATGFVLFVRRSLFA